MAPHRPHAGGAVATAGLAAVACGVHVEIARQVAAAVLVAPQVERHRRDGLRANQLTHRVLHGAALGIPRFHGGAQHAALHLAGHLGHLAVAADEGAAKVRATRDVVPPDIGCAQRLKLRRAPLLHLGRQRRAGGAQGADAREVAIVGQRDARLHAVGKKRRARAEEGHARLRRKAPQHAPVGVVLAAAGVAVKDDAGGARQQAAELRVPHHPAGGAVPVVALAKAVGLVAAANVVVQHLELQRHQHAAAVAMHDGLR